MTATVTSASRPCRHPAAEPGHRKRGEQGFGKADDGHVEVDQQHAGEHLLAAHVPQPLGDGTHAGRGATAARGHRRQPPDRPQRGKEAQRIHRVGSGHPGRGDQHAGEQRPDDHRKLERQ